MKKITNNSNSKSTPSAKKPAAAKPAVKKPAAAKASTTKSNNLNAKSKANAAEFDANGLKIEKVNLAYKNKNIVAITGCAAGIAHTFMAAEGIQIAASKMGIKARVETHGVGGVETPLTAKEIRQADLVLVAADISVDTSRFLEKMLYVTDTNLALRNPLQLIEEAFEKATKYKIDPRGNAVVTGGSNIPNQNHNNVLKHIMFALGWTIPLIISSGLVMAIGNIFSMDIYEKGPVSNDMLAILYVASFLETTNNPIASGWSNPGTFDFVTWFNDTYPGLISLNDGITDPKTIADVTVSFANANDYTAIEDAWSTIISDPSSNMYITAEYYLTSTDVMSVVAPDRVAYSTDPNAGNFWANTKPITAWGFADKPIAGAMFAVGAAGLALMYPLLAGALGFSIGGKVAFAPAFIGGWMMNQGSFLGPNGITTPDGSYIGTGFLGALAIGFAIGYFMRLLKMIKFPKSVKGLADLMLLPLIGLIVTVFLTKYVLGYPLGLLVVEMYEGLEYIEGLPGNWAAIFLGAVVGLMICTDLGGPINKTALVFGTAIFTSSVLNNPEDISAWNFVPGTATQAAISVPPLAAFLSATIFGRYFTSAEKTSATNAAVMGLTGITEGAIPFAISKPKAFVPANMIGGAYAGAMTVVIGMQFWGGLGSPLGVIIGYINLPGYGYGNQYWICILAWFFITISAALITAMIAGLTIVSTTKKSRYKLRVKTIKTEMVRSIKLLEIELSKGKISKDEFEKQVSVLKMNAKEEIKKYKSIEADYEKSISAVRKQQFDVANKALNDFRTESNAKLKALKSKPEYKTEQDKLNTELKAYKDNYAMKVAELKHSIKSLEADKQQEIKDTIYEMKLNKPIELKAIKSKNTYYSQKFAANGNVAKLKEDVARVNNMYLSKLQTLETASV